MHPTTNSNVHFANYPCFTIQIGKLVSQTLKRKKQKISSRKLQKLMKY